MKLQAMMGNTDASKDLGIHRLNLQEGLSKEDTIFKKSVQNCELSIQILPHSSRKTSF
jgi:hypothetical protein